MEARVADVAKGFLVDEEAVLEQPSGELAAALAQAGDRASEAAAAHHVRSFAKSPSQIIAALVRVKGAPAPPPPLDAMPCPAWPVSPFTTLLPLPSAIAVCAGLTVLYGCGCCYCVSRQETRIDHLTSELGEVRALLLQLKATV